MCRFTLYLGPPMRLASLLTEPRNSLIHQSFQSEERFEPLNGDGFGVAWYAPELSAEPGLFRSISPAWSNANLQNLARVTKSTCILAHVRAASSGMSVSEANCHPFTRGNLTFMHNGSIGGFAQLRRGLLEGLSDEAYQMIHGTTDSEFLFALFYDQLSRTSSPDPAEAMATALRGAIREALAAVKRHGIEEASYLNLAVSNGSCAVVTRYTDDDPKHAESLYLHTGKLYYCHDGVCHMIEPETPGSAVLVSSERLSEDGGWDAIPVNHMVVIDAKHQVERRPIEI